MSWNHRVVEVDDVFGIYEVYYADDHTPIARTETPIDLSGETYLDLHNDVIMILQAFLKPVMTEDDFDYERAFD